MATEGSMPCSPEGRRISGEDRPAHHGRVRSRGLREEEEEIQPTRERTGGGERARTHVPKHLNTKWLTDITEFQIPDGKVYLSLWSTVLMECW